MLAWLDNERVTRWIAIALAPVVVVCYGAGFYSVFGEFGGGDGSLPMVVSFFVGIAAWGAALRSITEQTRAQVNRERDEREAEARLSREAGIKAEKALVWRAWAMGNSGPLLGWIKKELDLMSAPVIAQSVAYLTVVDGQGHWSRPPWWRKDD